MKNHLKETVLVLRRRRERLRDRAALLRLPGGVEVQVGSVHLTLKVNGSPRTRLRGGMGVQLRSGCGDSGVAGQVPRGEKMLYSGTDPESYITEYTKVYEGKHGESYEEKL